MPDDKHTPASGEDRGYTPSSPVKRTLAWTGLAYALILRAPDRTLTVEECDKAMAAALEGLREVGADLRS